MSKITRNENGQYVWEYELDMYRNRNIFDLVMKILTVIFVFIIFAVTSMAVFNRTFDLDSLWFFLKIAIPIFLFVYLIAYLAYRFYACHWAASIMCVLRWMRKGSTTSR